MGGVRVGLQYLLCNTSLKCVYTSPKALASFSAALSSEDAVAVMGQFGVDPTVVAQGGGGVAGLLHALQLMVDAEPSGETPAPMDQSDA